MYHNERVGEGHYENGQANGIFKEYKNRRLQRVYKMQNDKTTEEVAIYNNRGLELPAGKYKKGEPYKGAFYEFDRYTNKLSHIRQYKKGELIRQTAYNNGKAYELIINNDQPLEGERIYNNKVITYKAGEKVAEREYKSSGNYSAWGQPMRKIRRTF